MPDLHEKFSVKDHSSLHKTLKYYLLGFQKTAEEDPS